MGIEHNSTDFCNQVRDMKYKYMDIWWDTVTDFPSFKSKYGFFVKKILEKKVDTFITSLSYKLKCIPQDKDEADIWQKDILSDLKRFGQDVLGFEEKHLDILFSQGYLNVTNEFIKSARKFNPNIEIFDIFQAIRNVWIMNSIQIFIGKEIEFTPSIFAYSMLYPYTDNYLDDPNCSIETKKSFNRKFRDRLLGLSVKADNKNEEDIFRLVDLIEHQYERGKYKKVYDSLAAIHDAQDKSLTQQNGATFPYEKDILGISFEKGGTSVLSDGYLVNGDLNNSEIGFTFGYGVFLQLADDLQDIQEDFRNGHMTVFSNIASKWPLDKITSRLFYFIRTILDSAEYKTQQALDLKDIIEFSCNYLIFGAVSKNRKFFSRKFIKKIEMYSPLRFSYLRKLEDKLRKQFSPVDIENITRALQE